MKKIPAITGIIKRKFLINFRIDPEILKKVLPSPFSPKLYKEYGIGGICLIRLENIRPKMSPIDCGISSENAAHRFAVTWKDQEGVYIPRRDTDSLLSHITGGRIFPGVHHMASFEVKREGNDFTLRMNSRDGEVHISFKGNISDAIAESSCFDSVQEASEFFQAGSLGYSDTKKKNIYDGLLLETSSWSVKPFTVLEVNSSYFDDKEKFPEGSVEFDHALFMENIPHEWHSADDLCCKEAV